MNVKSQNESILPDLKSGKRVTPLSALERHGVFRLSGRIFDLRAEGYPITTTMVDFKGKKFASYTLEK